MVYQQHGVDHDDEERVNDHGREDLDDRQHPHAEVHLLEQERTVENAVSRAAETFAEEKPGDYAAKHPEDERDVTGRLRFEADLKHNPEDHNVNGRMNKCPEHAEVGAEVLATEILLGKLEDHSPVQQQVAEKQQKNTQIIHGEIIRESCNRCKELECSPHGGS